MLIAILGRQAELSVAELESYFGADKLQLVGKDFALIDAKTADINHFGGCLKLAQLDLELNTTDFKTIKSRLVQFYTKTLPQDLGKITLGVSYYNSHIKPRQAQELGLALKSAFTGSIRLVPNQTSALSTAVSHHNKLGLSPKKLELIIVEQAGRTYIGRSLGAQNITAYVNRDRKRPKRDARVGMLPPKLAQILINLSRPAPFAPNQQFKLLDPFCGTGVVLQEAHLLGFRVVGSDLEPRMIDYTKQNLAWLDRDLSPELLVGDATEAQWPNNIDCVASETYLGYPFKSIQSPSVIDIEANKIEHLLSAFLNNLRRQSARGTRICIAVPAWLQHNGQYRDLEIIKPINLKRLNYEPIKFQHTGSRALLYHRDDQIVARRILVLQIK
ncbi:MAG: methyltransferase domain-containing protein [Candidatus Saccharibacteria bacterium]|nr:methyltransferase domain-containing protein [Candidatus Saccharibacteria bacterium]